MKFVYILKTHEDPQFHQAFNHPEDAWLFAQKHSLCQCYILALVIE